MSQTVFAKEESSGVHYEYTTEAINTGKDKKNKEKEEDTSKRTKLARRVAGNATESKEDKGGESKGKSRARPFLERAWHGLKSVFMPEGFPESVSEDYLEYQVWDTAQALCSTLSGLLSAKAILTGVGVGDSAATPTSAVLQYITRDVTGMAGRILFAWHKASSLDRNAKSWRLAADVMNDLAMFVELLSPLFPALFLWLACAGSLLRSLVGVAGAATRTALTMHQARAGNIADVTAKDGSQETAVNIAGLLIGAYLLNALAAIEDPVRSQAVTWMVFVALTMGHIYSNYRAVRAVVMETLNDQRAAIVARAIAGDGKEAEVPTPKKVAAAERIVWSGRTGVVLGATLGEVAESAGDVDGERPYVVAVRGNAVKVAMEKGIGNEKIIEAAVVAHTAKMLIERREGKSGKEERDFVEVARKCVGEVVEKNGCKDVVECLKKNGWNVSLPLFDIKDSRYILCK